MKYDQYVSYWKAIAPVMDKKMQTIFQHLRDAQPHDSDKIVVAPARRDDDTDWKIVIDITDKENELLTTIEITLNDGDNYGGSGLAFSLQADDVYEDFGIGYHPCSFASTAFTYDKKELLQQIKSFDAKGFAEYYIQAAREINQNQSYG